MKGFFPVRFVTLREFKEFLILTSHSGYGTFSEISLDRIIYLLSIGRGLVGRVVFWFERHGICWDFFPQKIIYCEYIL